MAVTCDIVIFWTLEAGNVGRTRTRDVLLRCLGTCAQILDRSWTGVRQRQRPLEIWRRLIHHCMEVQDPERSAKCARTSNAKVRWYIYCPSTQGEMFVQHVRTSTAWCLDVQKTEKIFEFMKNQRVWKHPRPVCGERRRDVNP